MLQLDVGHCFSSRLATDGAPTPEMLVRNRWVIQGYQSVHQDVVNLSYQDVLYAPHLFEKESYRRRVQETPVVRGFISANVRATREDYRSPPAYVIKELKGDRFPPRADGQRIWRVGVVGVTERAGPDAEPPAGYTIDDPLVAARRAILEARARSDLLVVLAYVSEATAFKLLDLNPEVDVVIVPRARWERRYRGEHGWVVYADPQTKLLGEVRVYLDESGRVSTIRERRIMLDDRIPGDPAIEGLVSAAHDEIAAAVKAWLGRKRTGR